MKKLSALLAALLLPLAVLAADYGDISQSREYTDSPFIRPEAVAISLLTRLDVVQGNPDGSFAAGRKLNRAEFLKIAMTLSGQEVTQPDRGCFPDVPHDAWFAVYVCSAKDAGIVKGNPDGKFHPERDVNNAEALKMLGEMYDLVNNDTPPGEWYVPYREGAYGAGVGLPGLEQDMGHLLTRGEMARLAAAYYAHDLGELEAYRAAERGSRSSSSSSVSSSSSSSSVSSSSSLSSSSISSSSSVSSPSSAHDFPARSRFLVAGERSQPIASNTFFANLEPMIVRNAEVKLEAEIEGIDAMFIIDRDGNELGQIYLDKFFDLTEKTWRGPLNRSGAYRIPKGEDRVLGVEIRMKDRNQGGTSEELVEVDTFKITTEGEWSGNSTTSGAGPLPYPEHQTAMGRITGVANAGDANGLLPVGSQQLLGVFRIRGSAVTGVTLRVENLIFQIGKNSSVNVANWKIGLPDSAERWPCSVSDSTLSCTSIPESLGTLGTGISERTFRIYGDVTLTGGATDKTLQLTLNEAGSVGAPGAVHWTDGTGHFTWVELDQPLARGTHWQ